jgi:adenine-specific DNA-methyltransferase
VAHAPLSRYVRSRGKLGRSLPPERFFISEKILVVRTRNLSLPRRIIATLDRKGTYNLNRLSNIVARPGYSLPGLLGILNSTLFNWIYSSYYYDYEIKPVYLRSSPLANSNDPRLISTVERMLSLHKQLHEACTPHEQTGLQRQIEATDKQIDALVYELYGLTEEEIRIVEGA